MRSSTATSSGRSIPAPDSAMRFLARVRRAAIVASGTRKAAAIDAVGTPHPSRIVSATCTSWVERRVAAQHDEAQLVVEHRRGVELGVGGLARSGRRRRRSPPAARGTWPAGGCGRSRGAGPRSAARPRPSRGRRARATSAGRAGRRRPSPPRRCRGRVPSAAWRRARGPSTAAGRRPPRRRRVVTASLRRGSPRSVAPRCSRAAPGSARRSCGRGRRRWPRRGSSRRGPP